jgi:molybdopterin synthase catalytic subunit
MLGLIDEDHTDLVETMHGYVRILIELGRLDEAEEGCARMMKKLERTARAGAQVSLMGKVRELQEQVKNRRAERRQQQLEEL